MTLYAQLSDLTGCDHLAAQRAAEALRIVNQAGTRGFILSSALEAQALVELLAGHHEQAAKKFSQALLEARHRQSGLCAEGSLFAYLARAHLGCGDDAAARVTADEAVEVARRQGARVFELQARLIRGRILADDADLRAALSLVAETGAVAYQPFCLEELARRNTDRAGLEEASRRFAAVGATGHVRRLAAELG